MVGDVSRFQSARKLVGYLGLDPKVRQSGEREQRGGHISRQGQAHARHLLVEAANAAVKTPGPLRGFYLRIERRRGRSIALVATARKLAVIAWHMLSQGEDYRFESESLSQRKLRNLQLQAGDEGEPIKVPGEAKRRQLERRLLDQAQRHYERQLKASKSGGAGPHRGRDSSGRRAAKDARQAESPQTPALLLEVARAEEDPTPRA